MKITIQRMILTALSIVSLFTATMHAEGFAPGTLVKTPTGYTAIEQLAVGDAVCCITEQGQLVTSKVTKTHTHYTTQPVSFNVGNSHLITDAEQQFCLFTNNNPQSSWQTAEQATESDAFVSLQKASPTKIPDAVIQELALLWKNDAPTNTNFLTIAETLATIRDAAATKKQIIYTHALPVQKNKSSMQQPPTKLHSISVAHFHNYCVTQENIIAHNFMVIAPVITVAFGAGGTTLHVIAAEALAKIVMICVCYTLAEKVSPGCTNGVEYKDDPRMGQIAGPGRERANLWEGDSDSRGCYLPTKKERFDKENKELQEQENARVMKLATDESIKKMQAKPPLPSRTFSKAMHNVGTEISRGVLKVCGLYKKPTPPESPQNPNNTTPPENPDTPIQPPAEQPTEQPSVIIVDTSMPTNPEGTLLVPLDVTYRPEPSFFNEQQAEEFRRNWQAITQQSPEELESFVAQYLEHTGTFVKDRLQDIINNPLPVAAGILAPEVMLPLFIAEIAADPERFKIALQDYCSLLKTDTPAALAQATVLVGEMALMHKATKSIRNIGAAPEPYQSSASDASQPIRNRVIIDLVAETPLAETLDEVTHLLPAPKNCTTTHLPPANELIVVQQHLPATPQKIVLPETPATKAPLMTTVETPHHVVCPSPLLLPEFADSLKPLPTEYIIVSPSNNTPQQVPELKQPTLAAPQPPTVPDAINQTLPQEAARITPASTAPASVQLYPQVLIQNEHAATYTPLEVLQQASLHTAVQTMPHNVAPLVVPPASVIDMPPGDNNPKKPNPENNNPQPLEQLEPIVVKEGKHYVTVNCPIPKLGDTQAKINYWHQEWLVVEENNQNSPFNYSSKIEASSAEEIEAFYKIFEEEAKLNGPKKPCFDRSDSGKQNGWEFIQTLECPDNPNYYQEIIYEYRWLSKKTKKIKTINLPDEYAANFTRMAILKRVNFEASLQKEIKLSRKNFHIFLKNQ